MEHTVQARTWGEVKVVFDPNLIDKTGQPVEASITYEPDGDDSMLVLTFGGAEPTDTGGWGVVIHALRAHAGAPGSEATR